MFPNYPQRPNIPNPYQIVGQAVGDFAGDVKTFGREQDALQERFRQMMEKRAQAELAAKQRQEDMAFKQAEEARNSQKFQSEQEGLQKAAKVRGSIAERRGSGRPLTRQEEIDLYLAEGLDVPKSFATPDPEKPLDREVEVGGVLFRRQPDGTLKQVLDTRRPKEPERPRLQQVTLEDGTIAVLDLDAGTTRPVSGPDGQPIKGSGKVPKLSEKMSNQLVDFSTGVNLLGDVVDSFDKNISQGPAGTGTLGSYVAGKVEALPFVGGKLAPETRSYKDQARVTTETLLRAATGAAAPEQEVTRYTAMLPAPGMSDQEAQSKMDAYTSQIRSKAKGTTDALRLMGRGREADEMERNIELLLGRIPKIVNPNSGTPGQVGRFKVRVKGN